MMTETYYQVRDKNGSLLKSGGDYGKFYLQEKAITVAKEESVKEKMLHTVEKVTKQIEEVWYANPSENGK